ncbi:MAG: M1 family aminopeptidase [Planctomycetota bacterium]
MPVPILSLLIGCLLASAPLQDDAPPEGSGWRYERLDLDLHLNPASGKIVVEGEATLRLEAETSPGPTLGVNSRKPIFVFESVGTPSGTKVELNASHPVLEAIRLAHIRREEPYRQGDTVMLRFRCIGVGESMQVCLREQMALGSWVECWYPVPLRARNESLSELSSAVGRTRLHLPSGWRGVTNGKRTAREVEGDRAVETWQIEGLPVARSFIAAPFTVGSSEIDGREIGVYLLDTDPELAEQQSIMLAQALAAMETRFGPYPYPSYAIAEVPFELSFELGFGASSEQGFIMCASNFIRVAGGNLPLFAHEAAHGWWGNKVGTTGPGASLCSESLAQYGAVLAIETLEGAAAASEFLRSSRAGYIPDQCAKGYFEILRTGRDKPLAELKSGGVDHTLADSKGTWFYHMLRRRVGDELFFQTLRSILEKYAGEQLSLAALREEFSKVAPAEARLKVFFSQWLDRTGAPILVGELRGSSLVLRQEQAGAPFDLNVEVELVSDDGATRRELTLRDQEATFELEGLEGVREIRVDPDFKILRWDESYGARPTGASSSK